MKRILLALMAAASLIMADTSKAGIATERDLYNHYSVQWLEGWTNLPGTGSGILARRGIASDQNARFAVVEVMNSQPGTRWLYYFHFAYIDDPQHSVQFEGTINVEYRYPICVMGYLVNPARPWGWLADTSWNHIGH